VKATETEAPSPTPTPKPLTAGQTITSLGVLGVMIGTPEKFREK
jgi:hypothetical protein